MIQQREFFAGTVTSRRLGERDEESICIMQVGDREFEVSGSIYNWVKEGEEDLVTFRQYSFGAVDVRKLIKDRLPRDLPLSDNQRTEPESWDICANLVAYGVPDPRIEGTKRELTRLEALRVKSVRVKNFPIIGTVVDVCWKGEDLGLGIISRLNGDGRMVPLMSGDVEISAHPTVGCWILSTNMKEVLSRERWECYQIIARLLLTTPISTDPLCSE